MIKRIHPLLIGTVQAGTAENDDGVVYIAIGPLEEEGEDLAVCVDEIEARALCTWLATCLGFTLTQPTEPTK